MQKEIKQKLVAEAFWTYARSGAFQRARLYLSTAADENKKEFRTSTKEFLYKEVFQRHKKQAVTEYRLKKIIEKLIHLHEGKKCLRGKKLRYGNAQKFVNLYLKAMWVTGFLKCPPHFPVDSIMIRELKLKYQWTNMDQTDYFTIITTAQNKLKENNYKSVAEWEAEYYQKKYVDKKGA